MSAKVLGSCVLSLLVALVACGSDETSTTATSGPSTTTSGSSSGGSGGESTTSTGGSGGESTTSAGGESTGGSGGESTTSAGGSGGATTGGGGGAGGAGGATTSGGGGSMMVNGCTKATATELPANKSLIIMWNFNTKDCFKGKAGASVKFDGNLKLHPLAGGENNVKDPSSPISQHNNGVIQFTKAGTFGYFCEKHASMQGAFFID